LLQTRTPPCVSLYQPTHRHHPDNRQDPIRFKNLLRAVEASLHQRYTGADDLLAPFRALAADASFWNHTLDGLAVLGAPGLFRVFRVPRPVRELALVADTFYVAPLLHVAQSSDRYQVLCVTREVARVFEGNRDALAELEPGTFPADIEIALGDRRTETLQTVAWYGAGSAEPGPMFHGHGSRKDEIDKDTERYFRAVDRAMIGQFSTPSELPLVLVALPEHQPVFRRISQNAALLERGVDADPEAMSIEQLRDLAWQVVEPTYLERLTRLSETFRQGVAAQRATADLSDAARAAVRGRISHLLVEAGRIRPGRIDAATGAIVDLPLGDPTVGDMLDDLAEAVLRTRGEVVVVPTERMPSDTGLAASFRY
jgi:hypothetical protein